MDSKPTVQTAGNSQEGIYGKQDCGSSGSDFWQNNPNKRIMEWEHLEMMRLKKLGLTPKCLSGHCQRFMSPASRSTVGQQTTPEPQQNWADKDTIVKLDAGFRQISSMAAFGNSGKPTCGYFFSFATENRKLKFGIPPSDLVKWRSTEQQ